MKSAAFDGNKITIEYYLFDINKGNATILHQENISMGEFEIPTGLITEESVFYVGARLLDNNIYEYSMMNKKEETILKGTFLSSLSIINDELYYVYSKLETTTFGLTSYSLKTKKTKEYVREDWSKSNIVMKQILDDGVDLYMVCDLSADDSIIYKMSSATKKIEPLFKTPYVSNVSLFHGFMSWSGERTIPNRSRLQQHVYDYKNKEDYLFDGGVLIGSQAGICWQKYLVAESEIPKGQVYNPTNSVLMYKAFP